MEKFSDATFKRDAAIKIYSWHEMSGQMREVDTTGVEFGFMQRKLMGTFNMSVGPLRTITGGEKLHEETGMIKDRTILTELFRVLQGSANINNVYKVIYHVILSFDCKNMDKDGS